MEIGWKNMNILFRLCLSRKIHRMAYDSQIFRFQWLRNATKLLPKQNHGKLSEIWSTKITRQPTTCFHWRSKPYADWREKRFATHDRATTSVWPFVFNCCLCLLLPLQPNGVFALNQIIADVAKASQRGERNLREMAITSISPLTSLTAIVFLCNAI